MKIRKWRVMTLMSVAGAPPNMAWWEVVTRRFTEAGARRTAARWSREGRPAAPLVLSIRTHGWGYLHEDEPIPDPKDRA